LFPTGENLERDRQSVCFIYRYADDDGDSSQGNCPTSTFVDNRLMTSQKLFYLQKLI